MKTLKMLATKADVVNGVNTLWVSVLRRLTFLS